MDTPKPGHPRFYELLERMAELHARKNHDYAGPRDPLRNLRRCADAGIPPWKGVVIRLCDKFDRLLTFAELEQYAVKDESVIDTFLDMAVYALLGIILFEEQNGGRNAHTSLGPWNVNRFLLRHRETFNLGNMESQARPL